VPWRLGSGPNPALQWGATSLATRWTDYWVNGEGLPVDRWVHASAVFDQTMGELHIYLNGREAQPLKIINTCYSFVSRTEGIRVSSVHEWDPGQGTLIAVKGSGGVSAARSEAEGNYAWSWARTIWADSLT